MPILYRVTQRYPQTAGEDFPTRFPVSRDQIVVYRDRARIQVFSRVESADGETVRDIIRASVNVSSVDRDSDEFVFILDDSVAENIEQDIEAKITAGDFTRESLWIAIDTAIPLNLDISSDALRDGQITVQEINEQLSKFDLKLARVQEIITEGVDVRTSGSIVVAEPLSGEGTELDPVVVSLEGITADYLADGAVTNEKLDTDAVTTSKVKDGAVTNEKLDTDAVTTPKVEDGAITEEKLSEDVRTALEGAGDTSGILSLHIRSDVTLTVGEDPDSDRIRGWVFTTPLSSYGSLTHRDRFTDKGYREFKWQTSLRGTNRISIEKTNDVNLVHKVAVDDVEFTLDDVPTRVRNVEISGILFTRYDWDADKILVDGEPLGDRDLLDVMPALGSQIDFNILERTASESGDRHLNWVSEILLTDKDIFTQEERTKLEGIEKGAEVNVQSDWNQSDTDADDFIKNKPTIPDEVVKYQLRSDLVITSAQQMSSGVGTGLYGWLTGADNAADNFGTVVSGEDDLTRQGYSAIYWSSTDLCLIKEGAATVSPQVFTFGDKNYLLSNPELSNDDGKRTYRYRLANIQDSDSDNSLADDGVTDLTTLFGTTGDVTCNILEQASDDNPRNNSWVGERDLTDFDLYTEAERDKLEGIADGAEANVQPDWHQSDTEADDYIKNKPVIPEGAEQEQADWEETDTSAASFIENKPTTITDAQATKLDGIAEGAEVNVQPDWDQTDTAADDFIKNKPTIPSGTGTGLSPADRTKLDGIAAGAEVNVQSDWDVTDPRLDSFIRNKPHAAGHTDSGSTIVAREDAKLTVGTQTVSGKTYNGYQTQSIGLDMGSITPDILTPSDYVTVKWDSDLLSISKTENSHVIPNKIKFGDSIYTLNSPSIDDHPVFGGSDYDFAKANITKPDGTAATNDDLMTLFPANAAVVDFNLQQSDGAWLGTRVVDPNNIENVQGDWLQADSSEPNYIRNKPIATIGTSELNLVSSVDELPRDVPPGTAAIVSSAGKFSFYQAYVNPEIISDYFFMASGGGTGIDTVAGQFVIEKSGLTSSSTFTRKNVIIIPEENHAVTFLNMVPLKSENDLFFVIELDEDHTTRIIRGGFLRRDDSGDWSYTRTANVLSGPTPEGEFPTQLLNPIGYSTETHTLFLQQIAPFAPSGDPNTSLTIYEVDLAPYIERDSFDLPTTVPTSVIGSTAVIRTITYDEEFPAPISAQGIWYTDESGFFYMTKDTSDSDNVKLVINKFIQFDSNTFEIDYSYTPRTIVFDPAIPSSSTLDDPASVVRETTNHFIYFTAWTSNTIVPNSQIIFINKRTNRATAIPWTTIFNIPNIDVTSFTGFAELEANDPIIWQERALDTDLTPEQIANLSRIDDLVDRTHDLTYTSDVEYSTLETADTSVRLKLRSSTRNARDIAADFDGFVDPPSFDIAANVASYYYLRVSSSIPITNVRVLFRPSGGDPNGDDDTILPGTDFKQLGVIGAYTYYVLAHRVEYPENLPFTSDGTLFVQKKDDAATVHTHFAGSLTPLQIARAVNKPNLPDSEKISARSLKDIGPNLEPYTAINNTLKPGTGVSFNNKPPEGNTPGTITINSASNISTSHSFHLRAEDRQDIHTILSGADVKCAKLHPNSWITMAKTIPNPGNNASSRLGTGERPQFFETDVHQNRDATITYGPIDVDNDVMGVDLTSDTNPAPATSFLDAVKGGRFALETINRKIADTDSDVRARVDAIFGNPGVTSGQSHGYSTLEGSVYGHINRGLPEWTANGYLQLRITPNNMYLTMLTDHLDKPQKIVFNNLLVEVPDAIGFDTNTTDGISTLVIPSTYTGLVIRNATSLDVISLEEHNGQPSWLQSVGSNFDGNTHVPINIQRGDGNWLYNSLNASEIACVAGHQLWSLQVENHEMTEKYLGPLTDLLTVGTYEQQRGSGNEIYNIDLARIDDDGRMVVVMNARQVVSGSTQHRFSRVGFLDLKSGAPVADTNTDHTDVTVTNITDDAFGVRNYDELTRVCNLREDVVLMLHKRAGSREVRATVARFTFTEGQSGARKTYASVNTNIGNNTNNTYQISLPGIHNDWDAILDVKETVDGEVIVLYRGSDHATKSAIVSLQSDANHAPIGLTVAALGTMSNSVRIGTTDKVGGMVHLTPERFAIVTQRNDNGRHVDFQEANLQGDNQNNQYLGELTEFNSLLDVDLTNHTVDMDITALSLSQGGITNPVLTARDSRVNSQGEINEVGGYIRVGTVGLAEDEHGVAVIHRIDETGSDSPESYLPSGTETNPIIAHDKIGGNYRYVIGPSENDDSVKAEGFSVVTTGANPSGAMVIPRGMWMLSASLHAEAVDAAGEPNDATAYIGSWSLSYGNDEISSSTFVSVHLPDTTPEANRRIQGRAEVQALIDSDGTTPVTIVLRITIGSDAGLAIKALTFRAIKLAVLK